VQRYTEQRAARHSPTVTADHPRSNVKGGLKEGSCAVLSSSYSTRPIRLDIRPIDLLAVFALSFSIIAYALVNR
jgi:hypothetical protein